ncbi:hypothetical protein PIB30_086256, partial [Stylosanthes scabra]|nr:hypothetical protein [Stylosanthes scabra]
MEHGIRFIAEEKGDKEKVKGLFGRASQEEGDGHVENGVHHLQPRTRERRGVLAQGEGESEKKLTVSLRRRTLASHWSFPETDAPMSLPKHHFLEREDGEG